MHSARVSRTPAGVGGLETEGLHSLCMNRRVASSESGTPNWRT
jgi:hypothetical protein